MSILSRASHDRRRLGRPKNPNKPPKDTSIAVYKATLDKIDELAPYPRMPLGDRLDSLLRELQQLRKKVRGLEVELDYHQDLLKEYKERGLKVSN